MSGIGVILPEGVILRRRDENERMSGLLDPSELPCSCQPDIDNDAAFILAELERGNPGAAGLHCAFDWPESDPRRRANHPDSVLAYAIVAAAGTWGTTWQPTLAREAESETPDFPT
jgi:hypothetical protein